MFRAWQRLVLSFAETRRRGQGPPQAACAALDAGAVSARLGRMLPGGSEGETVVGVDGELVENQRPVGEGPGPILDNVLVNEEEELAGLELAEERPDAVEPIAGLFVPARLEDDDRHGAAAGAGGDPGGEAAASRAENLHPDPFVLEMPPERAGVEHRFGRLEDSEDDGREEVESREEPEVLDDGAGGVGHDVGVDGAQGRSLSHA